MKPSFVNGSRRETHAVHRDAGSGPDAVENPASANPDGSKSAAVGNFGDLADFFNDSGEHMT